MGGGVKRSRSSCRRAKICKVRSNKIGNAGNVVGQGLAGGEPIVRGAPIIKIEKNVIFSIAVRLEFIDPGGDLRGVEQSTMLYQCKNELCRSQVRVQVNVE